MNTADYEKAKQEGWDALYNEHLKDEVQWQPVSRKEIFNLTFNRAYRLGMEAAKKEMLSALKFRVGDRVRWLGQTKDIGTIAAYYPDEPHRYCVQFGKEYHNIDESMLETYTEQQEDKPKFKVGDLCMCGGHVARILEYIPGSEFPYTVHILQTNNKIITNESDLESFTKPQEEMEQKNINSSDIDIDEIVRKGYVPDPTKDFDNIVKDGFRSEKMLNIATQILCAIIPMFDNKYGESELTKDGEQTIVRNSFRLADMMIKESEKKGDKQI